MAWANYDDVIDQLRGAGLILEHLEVGTARVVRCKVENADREKRGWYRLAELSLPGGDLVLVGTYGVWHGNDSGATKVELRKRTLTDDQRDVMRRRFAEDRKRADAQRAEEAGRAADKATEIWGRLAPDGDSPYLDDKHVAAYGLRFDDHGAAVLPLLDTTGRIHGLQFLRSKAQAERSRRPAKEFFPAGVAKKGHFHLIGSPAWVVLVAEGYATAASLHMATGLPVAVAFDAGNLLPVADALRKRYARTKVLVCADDDVLGKCGAKDGEGNRCGARLALPLHPTECPTCRAPHGYTNAGVIGASAAAVSVSGAWLAPGFADRDKVVRGWLELGRKLTDFNDLHLLEGLHAVRVQVEAKLAELRWAAAATAGGSTDNGGAGNALRPIQSVAELLERYVLVYAHQGTVFDRREHCLLSLSDMRDACIRRDIHRAWMESADRPMVRVREVGFDPAGEDPTITCNLWGGWPTSPQAGSCERLLELLRYVCSGERNGEALFQWVLRWLAYPIQHPGAKLKSTLVLHGPQGAGKNMFFEAYMEIFGQYGRVIGQDAIEDKFNDWASRKLFLIADEVVARSDLYHVKNKLKALITGDWIRINPKNVGAYDERNHVNLVFLSNEAMPVVLEEDDRRHCVVWTPAEQLPEFYRAVKAEIAAGGVAALHDFLLTLDLGAFGPADRPPQTDAKAELIQLGLDSPQRFWDEVYTQDVPHLRQPIPALATDWYDAYKRWCHGSGHKPAPQNKFLNALSRKRGTEAVRKRYRLGQTEFGPHSILWMGAPAGQPPAHIEVDGRPEVEWLGELVAEFRKRLAAFKGTTMGGGE